MPKGMREKMHAKEHEGKKRKRDKDSPYFQIKAFIQKRERVMIQGVPKIFRNRKL